MKRTRLNIFLALLAALALIFAAACSDGSSDEWSESTQDTQDESGSKPAESAGESEQDTQDTQDKQDESGSKPAESAGESEIAAITAADVEELLQSIGTIVAQELYYPNSWIFADGELEADDGGYTFNLAWNPTQYIYLGPEIGATLSNLRKASCQTELLTADLSAAEWDEDRQQAESGSEGCRYITLEIELAEGVNRVLHDRLKDVTIAFDSGDLTWRLRGG